MFSPESKQRFKAAFLARCLENGYDEEQIAVLCKDAAEHLRSLGSHTEKQAAGPAIGAAIGSMATDLAKRVFGLAPSLGLAAAVGIPAAAGLAGGWGLAKATDIDDTDVDEMKSQELLSELDRLAEQAERSAVIRRYRQQRS